MTICGVIFAEVFCLVHDKVMVSVLIAICGVIYAEVLSRLVHDKVMVSVLMTIYGVFFAKVLSGLVHKLISVDGISAEVTAQVSGFRCCGGRFDVQQSL